MSDDLPLLLVHGEPNQFNWGDLFRQDRGSGRFLDDEDMTALGRAFWVSSWIGFDEESTARWKLRVIRTGWAMLTGMVAMWLLVVIWWRTEPAGSQRLSRRSA